MMWVTGVLTLKLIMLDTIITQGVTISSLVDLASTPALNLLVTLFSFQRVARGSPWGVGVGVGGAYVWLIEWAWVRVL